MPTIHTDSPPSATHLIASAIATAEDLERYSKGALERADGLEGLTTITGIGSSSIDKFVDAGYSSIEDVATASEDELKSISGIGGSTAENIVDELSDFGEDSTNKCCFCGTVGDGRPLKEVKSKWFTDDDLIRYETGHVCAACAFCMDQSELKMGHWIATRDEFVSVESAALQEQLRAVSEGAYSTPFAVHVAKSANRNEHAYLWTPISYGTQPYSVDFSRETIRIQWNEFQRLLGVVEALRWHGYRFDDIRSGQPRAYSLDSLGYENAKALDAIIDEYRASAFLELVLKCSRGADDQNRDEDAINQLVNTYT